MHLFGVLLRLGMHVSDARVPEQDASHAGVPQEDNSEEHKEVEQIAGRLLDGARDQAHAFLCVYNNM